MASNPIADAHEQRTQSEAGDGDSNDDELGSHDLQSVGLDSAGALHWPCRAHFLLGSAREANNIVPTRTVMQG
jgi:hypothetical protein